MKISRRRYGVALGWSTRLRTVRSRAVSPCLPPLELIEIGIAMMTAITALLAVVRPVNAGELRDRAYRRPRSSDSTGAILPGVAVTLEGPQSADATSDGGGRCTSSISRRAFAHRLRQA